ncbi:hypothetical protein AOLI_G00190600 [Acnodon oligacanthus]
MSSRGTGTSWTFPDASSRRFGGSALCCRNHSCGKRLWVRLPSPSLPPLFCIASQWSDIPQQHSRALANTVNSARKRMKSDPDPGRLLNSDLEIRCDSRLEGTRSQSGATTSLLTCVTSARSDLRLDQRHSSAFPTTANDSD